jgi:hypothetical protein
VLQQRLLPHQLPLAVLQPALHQSALTPQALHQLPLPLAALNPPSLLPWRLLLLLLLPAGVEQQVCA